MAWAFCDWHSMPSRRTTASSLDGIETMPQFAAALRRWQVRPDRIAVAALVVACTTIAAVASGLVMVLPR
jgi:hypothetical protein